REKVLPFDFHLQAAFFQQPVGAGPERSRYNLIVRQSRCLLALLISASTAGVLAHAQSARRSVWDGVYTEAQAQRATGTFGQSCARCHTLDAQGSRPLVGEKFWERNTQKTVGDLLTFVRANMPNGNGGSLSDASYNDLVALILKSNGLPPGTTELAPDTIADV